VIEPLDPRSYRDIVAAALQEDVGAGDVTTDATVDPALVARGLFIVKEDCVLAGLAIAFEVFQQVGRASLKMSSERPSCLASRQDGDVCRAGETIGEVRGPAAVLLTAERVALNFLQRLSGIATRTRRFVDAAGGRITVLDTRKTTPTLRALEKYAVRAGGATNHRIGLYDAVLIKDNHVRLAGGVQQAIERMRRHRPGMPVEIEAQSLEQVDDALRAGAEMILLDNLSPDDLRRALEWTRGRARTEISGGVTLQRMPEIAASGADFVSVGGLTHSAPAIDISFEIEPL